MTKKKFKLQKANAGLQNVVVPEAGNLGNVMSSATSMASLGGEFGPWGMAAGAVAGTALGLFQKNQMDKANKAAINLNSQKEVMRKITGTDPTLTQGGQVFAKGTKGISNVKPIEVERDEIVFRKSGDRFIKKADFQGGKTHKQGGEPYIAMDGDIIFPGKQRKEVEAAYKRGDNLRLESMRTKLPKDTNARGEAKNGLDNGDDDKDKLKMLNALRVLEQAALADPGKYSKTLAIAKEKYREKYNNSSEHDNNLPGNGPKDEIPVEVYEEQQRKANTTVSEASLLPKVSLPKTEKGASTMKPDSTPRSAVGNIKGVEQPKKMPLKFVPKDIPGLEIDTDHMEYETRAKRAKEAETASMKAAYDGIALNEAMQAHEKVKAHVGAGKQEGGKGPEPLGFWDNVMEGVSRAPGVVGNFVKGNINAYLKPDAASIAPLNYNGTTQPSVASKMSTMQDLLPSGMNPDNAPKGPYLTPAAPGQSTSSSSTGGRGPRKPQAPKANPLKAESTLSSLVPTPDFTALKNPTVVENNVVKRNVVNNPVVDKPLTLGQKVSGKFNGVKTAFDKDNIGDTLNSLTSLAGVANNLVQSFSKPGQVKPNTVSPELIKYTDRSQAARSASAGAMQGQLSNARNLSGGSASNLRGNANQAFADNATRQMEISTGEAGRADTIAAHNVSAKNRANEVNQAALTQAQDIQRRNEAATQSYREQALADLGTYSQIKRQEKYIKARDVKQDSMDQLKLKHMNQWTNYTVDPDTGDMGFAGARYSNLAPKNNVTTREETKTGNKRTVVTTKRK